jgi:predicted transcriptional regulator
MTTDEERVVTARLPADLVARMDEVGARMERTKSWIVRQAVAEWLTEEERRHELTLQGLRDVDEGPVIDHEEILAMVALKKAQARKTD